MTQKPTEISAFAAAPRLIVKDPFKGTTFFIVAVESLVLITAKTKEDVVTKLLVTVTDVPAAAILTVPVGLSIV